MNITKWYEIPGYKKYVISEHIKLKDRKTLETIRISYYKSYFRDMYNKYQCVSLMNDNGTYDILLLHELAALVFLPNTKPWELLVIHINGKICDNRPSNLTRCAFDYYPAIITQIQLNERYTIYKFLNNGRLFDTFNSVTGASASTKTTRPLSIAAIHEACFRKDCTIVGVWYWRIKFHSRIPSQPRYPIPILSDPYFAKPIYNYLHSPIVITPHGFIYNSITGEPIYPHFTATRYLVVYLLDHNGNYVLEFVHHLVIKTFKSIPDNYLDLVIDHIDGNKANPHIDNLEWVTRPENYRRWREMYFRFSMLKSYKLPIPKQASIPPEPSSPSVFIKTEPFPERHKSSIPKIVTSTIPKIVTSPIYKSLTYVSSTNTVPIYAFSTRKSKKMHRSSSRTTKKMHRYVSNKSNKVHKSSTHITKKVHRSSTHITKKMHRSPSNKLTNKSATKVSKSSRTHKSSCARKSKTAFIETEPFN
jgi:hypothetical protein